MPSTLPFQPTPYPGINAVLQSVLNGAQAVLVDQFTGMILHGSLVNGDFEPGRSDIDFLVVTATELQPEQLTALAAMHAHITASGLEWAAHLEGSYIPRAALRRYDPAHNQHPALRVDGSFGVDGHGSDWIIQRAIIREKGIALAGPAPASLIDPISADELRQAASGILREWWAPKLVDSSLLDSSEYQAYAVLTMCRSLYTLQLGAVATKPAAARWAQAALGPSWTALIERALSWRRGMPLDAKAETMALIRFTLKKAHLPTPSLASR